MQIEIWKDIFQWFKVSSLWNIKSNKGKIRRLCKNQQWYNQTIIKGKSYTIHRLVWYAFLWLDLNDSKTIVCHKNDTRDDNRIDNLFLWTQKDNIQDAMKKWRMKFSVVNKKIYQYSLKWDLIKEWDSSKSVREKWITSHSSSCALWKRKTAGGFIWKYI